MTQYYFAKTKKMLSAIHREVSFYLLLNDYQSVTYFFRGLKTVGSFLRNQIIGFGGFEISENATFAFFTVRSGNIRYTYIQAKNASFCLLVVSI